MKLANLAVVFSLSCMAFAVAGHAGEGAAEAPEVATAITIDVTKTPTCGCCTKWVDHLEEHGFSVAVTNVSSTAAIQAQLGVPRKLASCHTAKVGDYWVEGHVPAEVIKQLLDGKRDDIHGIAVPGMPPGSPGMEAPNPVKYDVIAYGKDGKFYRFATVQGKSAG